MIQRIVLLSLLVSQAAVLSNGALDKTLSSSDDNNMENDIMTMRERLRKLYDFDTGSILSESSPHEDDDNNNNNTSGIDMNKLKSISTKAGGNVAARNGVCFPGWDASCQDNPVFISFLKMPCEEHTKIECHNMDEIGLNEKQVYEIITNCPCACRIPCGTWSLSPTSMPSSIPTDTSIPSSLPSLIPTSSPTKRPTPNPTQSPTSAPTDEPSSSPTTSVIPTMAPSPFPSLSPTDFPTEEASNEPTNPFPSQFPSMSPTNFPSYYPSLLPSQEPTHPTSSPTSKPSDFPTVVPTSTKEPSQMPSLSTVPTLIPTLSQFPTTMPTERSKFMTTTLSLTLSEIYTTMDDYEKNIFEEEAISFIMQNLPPNDDGVEIIVIDVTIFDQTIIQARKLSLLDSYLYSEESNKRRLHQSGLRVEFNVTSEIFPGVPPNSFTYTYSVAVGFANNYQSFVTMLVKRSKFFLPLTSGVSGNTNTEKNKTTIIAGAEEADYTTTKDDSGGLGIGYTAAIVAGAFVALTLAIVASVISFRKRRRNRATQSGQVSPARVGVLKPMNSGELEDVTLSPSQRRRKKHPETPLSPSSLESQRYLSAEASMYPSTYTKGENRDKGKKKKEEKTGGVQFELTYSQDSDDDGDNIKADESSNKKERLTSSMKKSPLYTPVNDVNGMDTNDQRDKPPSTSLLDASLKETKSSASEEIDKTNAGLNLPWCGEGNIRAEDTKVNKSPASSKKAGHSRPAPVKLPERVDSPTCGGSPIEISAKNGQTHIWTTRSADTAEAETPHSVATEVTAASGVLGVRPMGAAEEGQYLESLSQNSPEPIRRTGLYDVFAPPGPLGIVVDTTPDGPVVHSMKSLSSLLGLVSPGDLIVGLDDVDTRAMSAASLTRLMAKKAQQSERKITLLAVETC